MSSVSAAQALAGGEHTLVRTADGQVLSAGACGLGWCRTVNAALAPLFGWRRARFSEPASAVHASYYHNLAIGARTGVLYSWGCGTFVDGNNDGVVPALGPGEGAEAERPDLGGPPRRVSLPPSARPSGGGAEPERAVALTGGAYHSVILTSQGRVLTFGAGQLGQLGRALPTGAGAATDGAGLPVDPTPTPVDEAEDGAFDREGGVAAVGGGFYNTLAACASGALFCAGENQNCQCGAGPANLRSMQRVAELRDECVVAAAGGYCHTLALTAVGTVLSLGCGDEGQRGDGRPGDDEDRPMLSAVPLPCRATAVAAGANHSVVLGEDGHAYAFGSNEYGQVGTGAGTGAGAGAGGHEGDEDEADAHVLAPARVLLPRGAGRVTSVSAGYAHTVLRDEHGAVFTFGQNENGQLGLGVGAVGVASADTPQNVSTAVVSAVRHKTEEQ